MYKRKIMCLIAAVAVILVFQLLHIPKVSAATINGDDTSMVFEVLGGGGSHAPNQLDANPDGAYCTKETGATFRLENNLADYGIQNVYFTVTGWSYPTAGSSPVTVQATYEDGYWSGLFLWDNIGIYDGYNVECHAEADNGNIYTWSRKMKHDTEKPTLSGFNITADDSKVIGTDGNDAVNSNITVHIYATDNLEYTTSWVKQVQIELYADGQKSPVRTYVIPAVRNNQGYSWYTQYIDLSNFGTVEKKLTVQVLVSDYALNWTVNRKSFTYDKLSPRGIITKGTETDGSVVYYFTAQKDASGAIDPTFFFWTEANGQDDLESVIGQPISTNVWKATLYKSQHGNQTGLYNIHVWSKDILNNFNFAASTTYQMN